MDAPRMTESCDVVVLGAGYGGLMVALRLARPKWRLRIVLVSARDYFLERVRLQETIVTPVELRIPSLSSFVAGTGIGFINGRITSLDADQRRIRIACGERERIIEFRHAVYALGSDIDTDDVPGVAAHAYRLERGEGPRSATALRKRLQESGGESLRIVVVGGAETAVEVAGEIKSAWPRSTVTMLSRSRCGDFRGSRVENAIRSELTRLGVALIDHEIVKEVRASEVVIANDRAIPCDVCVWSGGLRSSPLARDAGVATDPKGRVWVDPNLRSTSHPHIFAVGDAAHPIAPTGAPYRLSAFAALVSGAYAADAIVELLRNKRLRPFSFSTFGQGVAIGRSGVGFFSYPDDRQRLFIVRGQAARHIRNLFVWLVSYVLKVERKIPGFFFWPGRRRVSWQKANGAMDKIPVQQIVEAT
ncbi:MAG: FAD-dependent oxidoreductase [Rhizobiales bacterium]|nr:FAD-dependent oxidoreductase [Hyphomicrobiales bacterium]